MLVELLHRTWLTVRRGGVTIPPTLLVMVIWRRGKPDALLYHSDRGSQYTSEQFQRLMADNGVACSMSRAGRAKQTECSYQGSCHRGRGFDVQSYRPGNQEGGKETASGEPYDPTEWTAAIQTDLREKFGGVRYGKLYRHTYALVEGDDKQAIIKINDVGPLKPGRIIDFNEKTMRYFNPTLQLGSSTASRLLCCSGMIGQPGRSRVTADSLELSVRSVELMG